MKYVGTDKAVNSDHVRNCLVVCHNRDSSAEWRRESRCALIKVVTKLKTNFRGGKLRFESLVILWLDI